MDDIVIIETTHDVHDGIDLADVGEELVAKAFPLTRASNKAGDIDEFNRGRDDFIRLGDLAKRVQTSIRNLNDAHVWVDRAKRIVCRLSLARARKSVEQCAFAHIGETYDTSLKHSREKMRRGRLGAILKRLRMFR